MIDVSKWLFIRAFLITLIFILSNPLPFNKEPQRKTDVVIKLSLLRFMIIAFPILVAEVFFIKPLETVFRNIFAGTHTFLPLPQVMLFVYEIALFFLTFLFSKWQKQNYEKYLDKRSPSNTGVQTSALTLNISYSRELQRLGLNSSIFLAFSFIIIVLIFILASLKIIPPELTLP